MLLLRPLRSSNVLLGATRFFTVYSQGSSRASTHCAAATSQALAARRSTVAQCRTTELRAQVLEAPAPAQHILTLDAFSAASSTFLPSERLNL